MAASDTWSLDRDARGPIDPESTIGLDQSVDSALEDLLEPGVQLGTVLGVGGTATVYRAQQTSLAREVAAKRLKTEADATESQRVQSERRLLQEARVTGALQHPNIVPIHDVVEADGAPTILLKLVEGDEWGMWLVDPDRVRAESGMEPEDWHLDALLAVCNAMAFAHARGVVHRDLKPANVLIGPFGEVVVTDWGLAAALHPGAPAPEARPGRIVGTPAYMAPEMFDSPERVSVQTDVYLLGGLLHRILLRRPPQTGRTLAANAEQARSPLSLPDTGLSQEHRHILERSLARDPSQRFESVERFATALRDERRHRGSLRLSSRGEALLDGLNEGVARDEDGSEQILTEAAFAFRAALQEWPGNPSAAAGLQSLYGWEARIRLDQGDLAGARRALDACDSPSADLAGDLQQAEQEAERLAALASDADPRVGAWTRFWMLVLVGQTWVTVPLVGCVSSPWGVPSNERLAFFAVLLMLGTTLTGFAGYRIGRPSPMNRRLLGALVATPPLQLILTLGLWRMGLAPEQISTAHFFLWSVTCAYAGVLVDWRLLVASAGYVVAFLVSVEHPLARYPIMLPANVLMCAVTVWIYWPRNQR